MTLIKSISGIRGTIGGKVGDNLTPLDLVKFASAYAKWLRDQYEGKLKVVIGRDARISGDMVASLVSQSLVGYGIDVIDLGLSTTPSVEMEVTHLKANGGIILTASHNPKQWNALKLLNDKGEFLSGEEGEKILEFAENESFDYVDVDHLGNIEYRPDDAAYHISKVLALPWVNKEAIKNASFSVVVDGIEFFKTFLDEHPFSATGWFNLGDLYSRHDMSEKAIESYDFAVSIKEDFAHAYFNKASVYANEGEYKNALDSFIECSHHEGSNPLTFCFIGECFEKLEDYKMALHYYEKVLEVDEEWADAWMGKAAVYVLMNEDKKALPNIDKAMELIPENADYWSFYARLNVRLDRGEESRNAFSP